MIALRMGAEKLGLKDHVDQENRPVIYVVCVREKSDVKRGKYVFYVIVKRVIVDNKGSIIKIDIIHVQRLKINGKHNQCKPEERITDRKLPFLLPRFYIDFFTGDLFRGWFHIRKRISERFYVLLLADHMVFQC